MTKEKGFAGLEALRGLVPEGTPPKADPEKAPEKKKGPAVERAVVRFERKGHGGKQVTVIEKLALPPSKLEAWCKEFKGSLGCGGTVDGDTIVLQGDLRTRLPKLLTEKGVGKVTVSG